MSAAAVSIVDVVSLAGDEESVNEDAWGTSGPHAWVIDGATGLGAKLLPEASDAAWFATTLRDALGAVDGAGARTRLGAAIEIVRRSFAAQATRAPRGAWEMPCASVMLATACQQHVELAWLGDCTALIRGGDGTLARAGAGGEDARAEAARAVRLGASGRSGWLRSETTIEALRRSRETYNRPGGAWVARLEPEAADHAQSLTVAIAPPARLLLMTDGFAALAHRYARYDHAALLAAAERSGLAVLGAELRRIERDEDPLGARYPRFKQSDDATAVLVAIGA
jgi:hypothetical protein